MTDKVEDEGLDLREEIAAAFKSTQEGAVIDKAADLARDETGKFAKKETEVAKDDKKATEATDVSKKVEVPGDGTDTVDKSKVSTDAQATQEGETKSLLTHEKPPQSWSPKARERWGEIPEDLRQEIIRREEASAVGVRQLQESFAPLRNFAQGLSPFIQEALQHQIDPGEYIGRVMTFERSLRSGTSDQKMGALIQLADQYQIPLRQILAEAIGKDVLPPPAQQLPPEVQRELAEARQFRQQVMQTQQQVQQTQDDPPELKQFAEKHPYFGDVRMVMADLIESGVCKDLESAYDEACWRNPGVREVLLEQKNKGSQQQDRQKAAAKVGATTGSADGPKTETFDDGDDLHATVRKAAAELANNRV